MCYVRCHTFASVFHTYVDQDFLVGRDPNRTKNGLWIDSKVYPKMISRVHATIKVITHTQTEDVVLIDSSVNGVFVNGVKVMKQIILREGDKISECRFYLSKKHHHN
jgi:pSer/pThr/pTyr-binding forkhead associated (FHA) protein